MEAVDSGRLIERYASGGPRTQLSAVNFLQAFHESAGRLRDDIALRDPERGVELDWAELRMRVDALAGGFAQLGVSRGDTVAMLTANRWEFIVCDLAVLSLGAVPFSVYATASAEQIAYVIDDAGAKLAIVDQALLSTLEEARCNLPKLETVIVTDGHGGDRTLAELDHLDPAFDVSASVDALGLDDPLTLIYTSGTTGPPKGVELSHRNILGLIAGVQHVIPFPDRGAELISWLPTAHIAERAAHYYMPMIQGVSITICPDPRRIVEFLPNVRPTWFFAVPRVWEKLKAGLEARLASLPDAQREQAHHGLEAARRQVRLDQQGDPVPVELSDAVAEADAQLFSQLRAQLGLDRAVAVGVGAAPTPVEVLEFFHAICIPVAELWGLSETTGAVTMNPPWRVKLGTAGPPLPGCEVRLSEDGEVQVRSDSVMVGYRNRPEATAEALTPDGWLLTGDIGELDADGYLTIVDRKKELIINASGKNMSPANIESTLRGACPLIGQAVAIGDGRAYNVALITLDADYAPGWAKARGIEDTSMTALAVDDRLNTAIMTGVEAANERLSRPERVKRFKVLPADWQPGGDELTPTMKLRRGPIFEKYSAEIEALYDDRPPPG